MTAPASPFDMIIVGASGDLAKRKLLPSLFYLHKNGELPEGRLLGVARHAWTRQEFHAEVEKSLQEFVSPEEFSDEAWQTFRERLDYFAFSATESGDYQGLTKKLRQHKDRVRVFYLATAPQLYGPISQAISKADLVTDQTRIVLEKPIGHDLDSAREINLAVGDVFEERQIYRIDHYLGKETVQNLMALRFGNAFFEPMWRSEHIDHVQITVAETLGMEGRVGYYDDAGALRDMVQNHLLQLLCLVAMEPPARREQDAIRDEKIKVLRALRPINGHEIDNKTVRGQYRSGAIDGRGVAGYLDELEEETGSDESPVETFVAIKAEIDNWRWAGVPFYLRTGKRMPYRLSEIVIQFKRVPHLLFVDQVDRIQDNRLVIRLQPDESIKLGMMVKAPGNRMKLKPVNLNLDFKAEFKGRAPMAYERLLIDVIRGNATLFMHRSEVEEAWRWCEPILDGWEELDRRPRPYSAGTWGPAESIALVVRDEREWYEHTVG